MQDLDKPDLSGLEYQIDALLQRIHQLKLENTQLHQNLSYAKQRLAALEEKNQHAVKKINQLIMQLKEKIA